MKYFKVFNTENEYLEYISSDEFITPNVSTLYDSTKTWITAEIHDYSKDYFTIESLEDNNEIKFGRSTGGGNIGELHIAASTDNGGTWTEYTLPYEDGQYEITTINSGDKIIFKYISGDFKRNASTNTYFVTSGNFNVYGNVMSLVKAGNFSDATTKYGVPFLLKNSKVVSAKNLIFPKNASIDAYSHYGMFSGCTSLIEAPELPATTLASECYRAMFYGCTSLTTAPELPATTLAGNCYREMFFGCTSLTTVPELLATTLAYNCYQDMFYGCTSLTTAPELPATTLASNCYHAMFQNCISLTTAPELPATTLAKECYYSMFNGCTSLTTAPELLATTLANDCYRYMFYGCTNLTTTPELLATTLATNCYYSMFQKCISLTTAPELLATVLSDGCYREMFFGCTSLTTAPKLLATTLANDCYRDMFNGCSNLNYIKCLAIDISANNCTSNWVKNVSSSGLFVKNPDMANWEGGNNGIPNNWDIKDDGEPIPVTGVSVPSNIYVQTNKTRNLNATVLPTYADNKKLVFESKDTSIVTVDENGVISGVSTGSTTIIVTTDESGFTAKCNVSVIEYSNYTLIEYIESTSDGGQYIDLDIMLYNELDKWYDIAIKFNAIGAGQDNQQPTLFGCQKNVSPWPGTFIRMNTPSATNTTGRYIGGSATNNTLGNNGTDIELPVQTAPNKNVTNLNNSNQTHNWGTSLFCAFSDANNTPSRFIAAKLYYFKLFLKTDARSQGTLVRDMIPCKRKSDNKVGLLDRVNNVFYVSPNGAEFVGGPEVNS